MIRITCKAIAVLAAGLLLSLPVLAAEGSRPPADGAKQQEAHQSLKARALDYIDAKIRILQSAKSCVRLATSTTAMLVCHEKERKQMKDLKQQARTDIQEGKTKPGEGRGAPTTSGAR